MNYRPQHRCMPLKGRLYSFGYLSPSSFFRMCLRTTSLFSVHMITWLILFTTEGSCPERQQRTSKQQLSDRYWFCFSFDWYFHNISFYYCFLYLIFSLEMNTWNDIILRHSFQSKKKNHVMSASNVPASARKYYVLMPVIRQKLSELNVAKILFEWHIWNTYINKAFGDFVSIIFFFLLWVPLGFLLQLSWNLFSINQLTILLP